MSTPVHKNIKVTNRNIFTLIKINKNGVKTDMWDDYMPIIS